MKITILNGSPQQEGLELYLDDLIPILEDKGHQVSRILSATRHGGFGYTTHYLVINEVCGMIVDVNE